MKREDWLKKLGENNPKSSMTYIQEHRDIIEREKLEIMDRSKAGDTPRIMHGAFGPETMKSDAYIKEELIQEGGGHAYILYGCSYLYRGTYHDHIVHGIQLGKSLLSEIPMKFLKNIPLALGAVFLYLFQRKKLLRAFDFMLGQIEWRVMRWYDIPEEYYNPATREIKRAVSLVVKNNLWGNLVSRLTKFVCLALETDNAYRLRLQDALYEAHARRLEAITVFDVIQVLIERETRVGIGHKWRFYRLLLRFALFLSPELSRIIRETLANLDYNKIKMDEHDWYFCLRFKSYNFRGLTEQDRLTERAQLDQEKHHVYFI